MRQHDRPLPPKLTQQVAQELHTQVEVTHEVAIRVVATLAAGLVVLRIAVSPAVLQVGRAFRMMALMNFVYVGFWEVILIPVDRAA